MNPVSTKDLDRTTFCPLPWTNVLIHSNGKISHCCTLDFQYSNLRDDNTPYSINDVDFYDFRNSKQVRQMRQQMLSGIKPPECFKCFERESLGSLSHRQVRLYQMPKHFTEFDLDPKEVKSLDIRLDNVCNLKCRTCNSDLSTLWAKENTKFTGVEFNRNTWANREDSIEKIKEMLFTTVDVYFAGGEPLLHPSHDKLLDFMIENDLAKNIMVSYNTNSTIDFSPFIDKWKKFRAVSIMLSVDGIGPLSRYIRNPTDWERVDKNLKLAASLASDRFFLKISTTVLIYNILHLGEVIDYASDLGIVLRLNPLFSPAYLNIKNMPGPLKALARERLTPFMSKNPGIEAMIKFMESEEYDKNQWNKFIEYTNRLDERRNENIYDVLPEFKDFIGERNV
jgi:MoaA/NifB/PqqE/SkfB family radical SAM enzyme